ncbi:Dabb family protein [Salmonella enterica]|uniref:Dabb family protein n=1 Tax=Salmonella enterica TaxID=28901 RepID=UPI0029727754|nr:Dabb family protein [Salmonella enterica]
MKSLTAVRKKALIIPLSSKSKWLNSHIDHVVQLAREHGKSAAQVAPVLACRKTTPSFNSRKWGANNTPEGKNSVLTHSLVMEFMDEFTRGVYLSHTEHLALKKIFRLYRPILLFSIIILIAYIPRKPVHLPPLPHIAGHYNPQKSINDNAAIQRLYRAIVCMMKH